MVTIAGSSTPPSAKSKSHVRACSISIDGVEQARLATLEEEEAPGVSQTFLMHLVKLCPIMSIQPQASTHAKRFPILDQDLRFVLRDSLAGM
jgi:hypothetical protein